MRSTWGMSQKHSRNTSGVQASRCCSVPRFSCAQTEDPANSSAAVVSGCNAPARRIRARDPAMFDRALPSRPIETPSCAKNTQDFGGQMVLVRCGVLPDDRIVRSSKDKR